jgi:hypothetical protein
MQPLAKYVYEILRSTAWRRPRAQLDTPGEEARTRWNASCPLRRWTRCGADHGPTSTMIPAGKGRVVDYRLVADEFHGRAHPRL